MQLSMLSDEVERLISVTHKLLQLSQADGGGFQLDRQSINVMDVLGLAQEDVMSLMPGIQFNLNVPPKVCIQADPNLFQQFVNNLVSNAVKYTSTHGQIDVKAEMTNLQLTLTMSNITYLDVSQLDDRVFERFFRFTQAESPEKSVAKGDGLGLSLCKEIVKAHGGQLSLQKGPGQRVTFVSTWPLAS
jgi:signal transduction histidine kinase